MLGLRPGTPRKRRNGNRDRNNQQCTSNETMPTTHVTILPSVAGLGYRLAAVIHFIDHCVAVAA